MNDEIRMTNAEGTTEKEGATTWMLFRHSDFVIVLICGIIVYTD